MRINKKKRFLLKGTIAITCFIAFLILWNIISMISGWPENAKDYFIDPNSPHWRFKSIKNLIVLSFFHLLLCISYNIIALYALSNDSNRLFKITLIYIIIWLAWIIRYYTLWYLSDLDHYPGFNPYIF